MLLPRALRTSLIVVALSAMTRDVGAAASIFSADPAGALRQRLTDRPLAKVEIEKIELVASGTFQPPEPAALAPDLPAFCRVAATLKPSTDSVIRIEVWLPLEGWNGRLLGTGNGGAAGRILYAPLSWGVKRGFATVNTDLGTGPNSLAAVGRPERWADFGHRATHEMTRVAKELIMQFYGRTPHHSYYVGSSTGGQQGLVEAQRQPSDYDGYFIGAPANNRTHLHVSFLWDWLALNQSEASRLTAEQFALVQRAVLRANVGKDGGAPSDEFLTDPRLARFDPATLLAKSGETGSGDRLSAPQVEALRKVFAGAVNPRTRERIYTPPPLGNAAGLMPLQQPPGEQPAPPYPWILQWAFGANYDFKSFDFDRDVDRLNALTAASLNAQQTDLSAVREGGGKILMYVGTADVLVPYQDTLHYFESVAAKMGGMASVQRFFRLFVVPGMGHTGGGPGLNDIGQKLTQYLPQDREHDGLTALMSWVEQGNAPDRFLAAAYHGGEPAQGINYFRPVFPYPKFPHYREGPVKSPESFDAVAHALGGVEVTAERYLK